MSFSLPFLSPAPLFPTCRAHRPTAPAAAAPGGPAHPPATKPPPLSKWRPGGDGGFTPVEKYVNWPPFWKRALVTACPAASASAAGEPLRLGGRGSGRPLRTDPGVTLTAWGASGFQERRNLKDPPCFHIGTEVRRVRLHMG